MARTDDTSHIVTSTVAAGLTPSFQAAAGAGANNGNKFVVPLGAWPFAYIKNASAGSITATVKANGNKASGVAMADIVYTIPGTDFIIPPLDPQFYVDSSGYLNIDWSSNTSVTYAPCVFPNRYA